MKQIHFVVLYLIAFISLPICLSQYEYVCSIDHASFQYYEEPESEGDTLTLQFSPPERTEALVVNHVPRYFTHLAPEIVSDEVLHHAETNEWRENVLLEVVLYSLKFSTTTWPAEEDFDAIEALMEGWTDMERCNWKGITCSPNTGKIIAIKLDDMEFIGTISSWIGSLTSLQHISLNGNEIKGTIPDAIGSLKNLQHLLLRDNNLTGKIPKSLLKLKKLKEIHLGSNILDGPIPDLKSMDALTHFDGTLNHLSGSIPTDFGTASKGLKYVNLGDNGITGRLPKAASRLESLERLFLFGNAITGSIPKAWMRLSNLKEISFEKNQMTGTIPPNLLKLSHLQAFSVSGNKMTGKIPRGDDVLPGIGRVREDAPSGGKWLDLSELVAFDIANNDFEGTLPPEFLYGLGKSLQMMDISNNTFNGTIPVQIGAMTSLRILTAANNQLSGTLPAAMDSMTRLETLNLTNNLLVGAVPKRFCGTGAKSNARLFKKFGCDAAMCPAETFHPSGAATRQSGCRVCPKPAPINPESDGLSKVIGRTSCDGVKFIHGDVNGDGILSEREILHLLYVDNSGEEWGNQFSAWGDVSVDICQLHGVLCVEGSVGNLDLSEAAMCNGGGRKAADDANCLGLPAELAQLSSLEVLILKKRQFLRGTIPTEFGRMTTLRHFDLSGSQNLAGSIPSELGRLTNLKFLSFAGCLLTGSIPSQLFRLTNLEKLHLSTNPLTGTLPTAIKYLRRAKELMLSRLRLSGTIPEEIGELVSLENLELYGNDLGGTLPAVLANCTNLKRVDLFNNAFVGTIPEALANLHSLQILHVKLNELSGTIPPRFGNLPFLSWFDVSANRLYGTIPATFANSNSLKDFRLGGNMIYEPIPTSLCTNTNINSGLTRMYGCDGVICPLGTYSDSGHATHADGCKPCEKGTTTMYLGSSECTKFTQEDILAIFFQVIHLDSDSWADPSTSACEWHGVECDDQGDIESMRFPMFAVEDL